MALTSQAKSWYAELQRHKLNPHELDPPPQLKNVLNQLKIHLAESGLLFPTASASTEQEKADLVLARDVLEFGALFSIRTEDVPSFERYMSLLSAFYAEPSQVSPPGKDQTLYLQLISFLFRSSSVPTRLVCSLLPESQNRAALSALSLLRLLSQNRIAEFHTTLETLSSDLILSREITWVLELERSLMEGSYSKVYSLCSNPSNLPRVEFKYFISTLLSTVRSEIASCDERAYATLPLRDAQTLLFFSNEADVRTFANERGWSIDEGKGIIRFGVQSGPLKGKSTDAGWGLGGDKEMNKERIVASVVGYAKELESIV